VSSPLDPLGPVVITSREIYDQLRSVVTLLERAIAKLDDHAGDLKDHENRLRALERARWPLPSLAVLVSLAALALAFLKP
jgi:hypothetical protein